MNEKTEDTTPILNQSIEERRVVYENLPRLGGDPQNTGGSVAAMVERVGKFAERGDFVSVINIKATD